jgi:hypothetical protein
MKIKLILILTVLVSSFGCSHNTKEQASADRKIAQEDDIDSEIERIRDNLKPSHIFKDSEDRAWVILNNFKVDHIEAKKYCKKQGLKLPTKALIERLESEITKKAKEGLIADWFWTNNTYQEKAWAVFVYQAGEIGFDKFWVDGKDMQVICVTKE